MDSFYNSKELMELGLKCIGEHVKISRKCSIYSPETIVIGNNVRIDDFCILSGKIEIGSNVHVAAYSALYGGDEGIFIDDFANLSGRVSIYSVSDDYSGETMTNPTIPDKFKNVKSASVIIGKHVIIGASSVILPGVVIAEGGAFGSFSFINKSTESWKIYAGIPIKEIKDRSKNLLNFEIKYIDI